MDEREAARSKLCLLSNFRVQIRAWDPLSYYNCTVKESRERSQAYCRHIEILFYVQEKDSSSYATKRIIRCQHHRFARFCPTTVLSKMAAHIAKLASPYPNPAEKHRSSRHASNPLVFEFPASIRGEQSCQRCLNISQCLKRRPRRLHGVFRAARGAASLSCSSE